ncbi:uncharacterized protein LOC129599946 [Paramacrobiotus metropolitanus]|uniref:uncharacterized protein LOC129599946 n=1 Tax=Paramacrobiotus metropolitanus TaxID=2943436 RepID=UPI002445C9C0|nr:uncharacterized protein LOC129599946 [Paramacrobiotus metropolitanus]
MISGDCGVIMDGFVIVMGCLSGVIILVFLVVVLYYHCRAMRYRAFCQDGFEKSDSSSDETRDEIPKEYTKIAPTEATEATRVMTTYQRQRQYPLEYLRIRCPVCFEPYNRDLTKRHYRSVVARSDSSGFGFACDEISGPGYSGEYWLLVVDVFDQRIDIYAGDLIRSVNGKKVGKEENSAESVLKELFRKTGEDTSVTLEVELCHELGPLFSTSRGFYRTPERWQRYG